MYFRSGGASFRFRKERLPPRMVFNFKQGGVRSYNKNSPASFLCSSLRMSRKARLYFRSGGASFRFRKERLPPRTVLLFLGACRRYYKFLKYARFLAKKQHFYLQVHFLYYPCSRKLKCTIIVFFKSCVYSGYRDNDWRPSVLLLLIFNIFM